MEEKTLLALRRDLSMSKDVRDLMRANVGFAAYMFKLSGYYWDLAFLRVWGMFSFQFFWGETWQKDLTGDIHVGSSAPDGCLVKVPLQQCESSALSERESLAECKECKAEIRMKSCLLCCDAPWFTCTCNLPLLAH